MERRSYPHQSQLKSRPILVPSHRECSPVAPFHDDNLSPENVPFKIDIAKPLRGRYIRLVQKHHFFIDKPVQSGIKGLFLLSFSKLLEKVPD
jgi:hypothetical protein